MEVLEYLNVEKKLTRLNRPFCFIFKSQKALKPVIAVLAVQTSNGKVTLYRGTNMEVSMPTGSLCAERNVIGTALGEIEERYQ